MMRELDKKATKDKAVRLLSAYKQLKRLAGEQFTSKVTATYSFEPRSFTGIVNKPLEKYIERQMTAQKLLDDIEEAINHINDAYLRQVLVMKYCKSYDSDIAIYVDLGYSESEFYRTLEKAILLFAECYSYGALLVFVGGVGIDDILDDLGEITK